MTVSAVRDMRPQAGHPSRGLILALMSACVVLTVALVAAVNLAIPKLSASSLHPSSAQLLWIVDSYLIVFACLLIPAGAFGDRYGRKGALLAGLGVFAVGCLMSAVATDVTLLIVGRAVSGAGAALIMPATLSLVVQSFPAEKRPQAIATWTVATGVAGILGNVGGGVVLEYLSWRSLFWVIAPIALVLLAASAWLAPAGERHPADLDPTGSVLLTLGFVSLLYGIIEGPAGGWTSRTVLGAFGLACVIGIIFVLYALRAAHPVFDPRIFAQPGLRAGTLGVGLTFFGLFALFFVNAQYLQFVRGYSPMITGLAIVPLALGMLAVSRRSITLAARFGVTAVVAAGLVILAAGLAVLSLAGPRTPYGLYAVVLVVISVGMGLATPSQSSAIIRSLPASRAGLGSGLNSASRELGSALGVAIIGTVLSSRFLARLPVSDGHRAHSTAQALALAQRLGGPGRLQVVTAFTDAISVGYRVVAAIVFVLAIVVTIWFRQSTRAS
jgi:EmrB/QacA subfamily drug resistance transporter